ncbi:MAG: Exodeoxyribonuclease [Nitrospira sp.]|jgi:exodeoxyribonuclease-3|nr:Exodeoxyribonuclease [Nitrospira sp.]
MLIASWNVNSLKSRLSQVVSWLKTQTPDVLLLQELKGTEFPVDAFRSIGFHAEFVAQKAYNGVATLSRHPIKVVSTTLAGNQSDSHARYLETTIKDLRIINIYLPNGNPVGTEKFDYKLAWMERLKKRLAILKKRNVPTIVGGDFNVIPEDIDCFSPKYWKNDALFQPEPRERFRGFLKAGYVDAFRHFNHEPGHYTFWEYFLDHWSHNRGIRIDHFLVSSSLQARMTGCLIDKGPRGLIKPSDHTPIILAIKSVPPEME